MFANRLSIGALALALALTLTLFLTLSFVARADVALATLSVSRSGDKVIVLATAEVTADDATTWDVVTGYDRLPDFIPDMQTPFPQSPLAPFPMFGNDDYLILKGRDAGAFRQGYLRVVGGTTWHWSGLCWRHLPVDLRLKSTYGVGRDWPFSYEELEPYYVKAEQEMGVSGPTNPKEHSPAQRSAPYAMESLAYGTADRRFSEIAQRAGYTCEIRIDREPRGNYGSPAIREARPGDQSSPNVGGIRLTECFRSNALDIAREPNMTTIASVQARW